MPYATDPKKYYEADLSTQSRHRHGRGRTFSNGDKTVYEDLVHDWLTMTGS